VAGLKNGLRRNDGLVGCYLELGSENDKWLKQSLRWLVALESHPSGDYRKFLDYGFFCLMLSKV
jgi:hypothetical protein